MNTELSFGQKADEENGLIMPWFSWPALDEIKSMDLSDKKILMYGSGRGDEWLSRRCKELHVVERDSNWLNSSGDYFIHFRPCRDSDGQDEFYLQFPEGFEPDIIISDDAYRTEAVRKAIDYFQQKEGGGVLICDNYWQDYVWKSPIAIEWLEPFQKHIHIQADHTDHSGDCWKTAIIFIK